MSAVGSDIVTVARVDGAALHEPGETLAPAELRQRACVELLRQAAARDGVADASPEAIERWLDRVLDIVEPDEAACLRHYEANLAHHRRGERATLRHILFAVTPGVNVDALRRRAEALLVELRASDDAQAFAHAARRWSNCPSGADGGELGTLGRDDCAPELARDVFGHDGVGVLPRLLPSRFGFHIVDVVARERGHVAAFEEVRGEARRALERQAWATALRRLVSELAAAARVEGVDLDPAGNG